MNVLRTWSPNQCGVFSLVGRYAKPMKYLRQSSYRKHDYPLTSEEYLPEVKLSLASRTPLRTEQHERGGVAIKCSLIKNTNT